jgi:3-hydroxybutyryl-CoA dehydrogenase
MRTGLAVAVVGTGRMAEGIAITACRAGHDVTVLGRDPAKAAELAARVGAVADGNVTAGAGPITVGVADADLAIETIVEDFATKVELLASITEAVPATALVATNTSSLSVGRMGEQLAHPERFFGLHFLNPAHETPIVEVAGGGRTAAATLDAGCDFARSLGKRPIRVDKDVPGFVWNRLQFAVLRECLHLLDEGVATAEDIDLAMSAGLAPRWMAAGPLATADLGGVATFAAVSEQLFGQLSSSGTVSETLRQLAREGGTFDGWSTSRREEVLARRAQMLSLAAQFVDRGED